jgi:hypothetical protein
MHRLLWPPRVSKSMDEEILKAAKRVYDHLEDNADTSVEYDLLLNICEEDGPNCADFVIDLSLISMGFSDGEMADHGEVLESQIDDTARINYMRGKIKNSLDNWSEEHPSLTIREFIIDGNETLIFCGVVDGYSKEIEWLSPSRCLEDLYKKTAALGLLSDNEDLEALSDSDLLALWY